MCLMIFGACSSENTKEESSRTKSTEAIEDLGKADSSDKSQLPDPCKIVGIETIQSTYSVQIKPPADSKATDYGVMKTCKYVSANSDPYAAIVEISVEEEGSNLLFEPFKNEAKVNDSFNLDIDGVKTYFIPAWYSTMFEYDDILYTVKIGGNEKDLSSDKSLPSQVLDDKYYPVDPATNLSARYLVARSIIESLKN